VEIEFSVRDLQEIQAASEYMARRIASGDLLARVGLKIEQQAKICATGQGSHFMGRPNVQTGRLRASITVQLGPEPVKEAVVGTNVEYAPAVEFGHAQEVGRYIPFSIAMHTEAYGTNVATGKVARHRVYEQRGGFRLKNPTAPAYPFMQPALDIVQQSGEMEGVFAEFGTDLQRDWTR
jgi:phage gpG-like protein